jgi:hypothetical protein
VAVSLTNCTLQNNTSTNITVVPNAPAQSFTVLSNGSVNAVTAVFSTIEVNGEDLDTDDQATAQQSLCIFNLVNNQIRLMVPPNSSAVFT